MKPEVPSVLHEDNHLLVLAKPAGFACVPDESGDPSLLEWAKGYVKQRHAKPGEVFLGVVHRLDRPVSGVVVFARTSKAAARLSQQMRERAVQKIYWGLVAGTPPSADARVQQWLLKDEARNLVRAFDSPRHGALESITQLRRLATLAFDAHPATWLELRPETGRPHQLRLACASLHTPLLGDLKYGATRALPDRSIALHAHSLSFAHPTLHTPLSFRAEPPARPWWQAALAAR